MITDTTLHFDKLLAKKLKKNPQLKNKINKQIGLLKIDLKYPSLKLHKLEGKRAEEYSIWIEGNLRFVFLIVKSTILFTDIITHDEY